jgi:hypothetical protein
MKNCKHAKYCITATEGQNRVTVRVIKLGMAKKNCEKEDESCEETETEERNGGECETDW